MIDELPNSSRRRFLTAAGASTAAALFSAQRIVAEESGAATEDTGEASAASPISIRQSDMAVVFIDPQNDVLSETGKPGRLFARA